MTMFDKSISIILLVILIGALYLLAKEEEQEYLVKELTVTEVTMKEREINSNVSEIYYIWKVCDGDFCFDMERNRSVKIGYKLQ